jgi:phosphoribosylglycinamide formyltransferase-1
MPERFIGRPLTPEPGSCFGAPVAIGAPALPAVIAWNHERIEVAELLAAWKESGPCRGGSSERYLRKHWFHIRTSGGREMKLYFERQPRTGQKNRWHLYSIL